VAVLLISCLVNTGLVYYAWRKRLKYAKEFAMAMATVTIYAFGYAGELAGNTLNQVLFWSNVEYFGIPFIPHCWLLFIANYVGWQGNSRRRTLAVSLGFAVGIFLLHQTQVHHRLFYVDPYLVKEGPFMVLHFAKGIGYRVSTGYIVLTSLTVILLMFQMRRLTQPVYRQQAAIMIWASLIPWLSNLAYFFNLGPRGLDVSSLGLTVTGALFVMGMRKFKLFDLVPIARERIFENMRDGVLALDPGNRIVDYNPAAQALLPELRQQALGQTADAVLAGYPELRQQIANNTGQVEFNYRPSAAAAGQGWLESRLAQIAIPATGTIGKMIILSDITKTKQTLAQLIQSERIAVLGRLVANVAHEMNSPLAAIKATAVNLNQSLEQFWRRLPADYGHELTTGERELFQGLLAKLETPPALTAREERQAGQRLAPWLAGETAAITEMARLFVKLGVAAEFGRFLPLCREPGKAQWLRLGLELAVQRRNIKLILQAEAKTARIVYALNCYSHDSRDSAPVLTDLRAGLETVLQIYENVFKNGIQTVVNWQPVAPVPAFPEELQQVWTNLIHNAVQAMQGAGELRIDLEDHPDGVKVSFTDNGPGIDPEILPYIFEPFFTTKKVGEGSGLGLNICREIVTRHRGTITAQSEPGRTRFTVCLPKQGDVQ
jgi:two-component system NtrC family sensor kinase